MLVLQLMPDLAMVPLSICRVSLTSCNRRDSIRRTFCVLLVQVVVQVLVQVVVQVLVQVEQ